MSREFRIIAVVLLAGAVLLFQIAMKEPPDRELINEISAMRHATSEWLELLPPELETETLDGDTFVLSEVIGSQLVILNFFATWCGPCAAEIPEFNRYFEEHHEEGVVILGIDVNEQEHVVRSFADRHRMVYPVGLDPNGDIARNYDVRSLPTTIVIGTDGRVKLYETGAISNADIAFNYFVFEQLEAIQDEPRITPDLYRSLYADQGHPRGWSEDPPGPAVELDAVALDFASRIRCPSCGGPVVECDGKSATTIKNRLASMDLENRTDGDVLQELFLIDWDDR